MINNFDSFNEELLGIDLNKIKKAAFEYHQTPECMSLFSEIEPSLLKRVSSEFNELKSKYGIDNLIKQIFSKVESKNEEVAVGYFIFSAFGIHAFIKLLNRIRKKEGFGKLAISLITSSRKSGEGYEVNILKSIRDTAIVLSFLIYTCVYIRMSSHRSDYIYKQSNGSFVFINLPFTWNGLNNFYIYDGVGKRYELRKISPGKFEIYKSLYEVPKGDTTNNHKIGYYESSDVPKTAIDQSTENELALRSVEGKILDLNRKEILFALSSQNLHDGNKITPTDLEFLLNGFEMGEDGHLYKINKPIINENVAQAKKILSYHEIDYDKIISDNDVYNMPGQARYKKNRAMAFLYIKRMLVEDNSIGYLGLLTKLTFEVRWPHLSWNYIYEQVRGIYNRIKNNRNILNRLRDSQGNLKNIMDFGSFDELNVSLNELEAWKKINQLIREIPTKQKNLIWRDGYFLEELKGIHTFLRDSILELIKEPHLKETFLKKVSRIKTTEEFIKTLSRIVKKEPWEFDYWLNKLENTRNVYVTWSDKEQNQIICMVFSWISIRKIAYMTNWCILSHILTWRKYYSKGSQCILYDFNKVRGDRESVIGFTLDSEMDRYWITDCHDKNDSNWHMDYKFRDKNERGTNLNAINPKFLQLDLKKAMLKLDSTSIRAFKNSFSNLLKNKYVANFLDFYD